MTVFAVYRKVKNLRQARGYKKLTVYFAVLVLSVQIQK